MKKLKVAFGIPLLAISLTACSDNASETTTEKESSSEKLTAVHSKDNSSKITKKEGTPSKLQTKASTIQKAVNSKEADRDYILNVMAGYQYIQVGDNQYIYYGINQEQNVFSMMEVNFDASGDYVQNINFVDNASEKQITALQNQAKEQQEQLTELEQQRIEKELDDYYIKQEQERQKAEEAQAKADAEAERKAEEKRLAEEEKKQREEEAQAKAEAESNVQAEAEEYGSLDEEGWVDVITLEEATALVYKAAGIQPSDTEQRIRYMGQDADGVYIFNLSNYVIHNKETGEAHDEFVAGYNVDPLGKVLKFDGDDITEIDVSN